MMKKATQEAVTWVFWDMNMRPVPEGCDPRVFRGCIKRFLEKNGYCGPLTITAFGRLGEVPRDMLRGVYSSGIALTNVPKGSSDVVSIVDFVLNPPPANFMLISDPQACPHFSKLLRMLGYNPVEPFPYDSLERLILEDSLSGEFEEEEETGEPALWDCLVCARDPPGQCFETFTTHLDSEEHHELMSIKNSEAPRPPVDANFRMRFRPKLMGPPIPTIRTKRGHNVIDYVRLKSTNKTYIFWDVNLCPVPPGFDASLVGPCIKRFLKKEGCSGPLTITAIGLLTDIPIDILGKVYSSGITLHNVPYGPSDTAKLISDWSYRTSGLQYSIMVISTAKIFAYESGLLRARFYLLKPFPIDSLQIFCLAGALEEEDKCCESGDSAFWICSVCDNRNIRSKGFESFTNHLSGSYHQQKLSELLPPNDGLRILSKPLSEPAEINLEAVTAVFWDMKICPVPPGFDPRRIGPCIKRYLANKGYSGPLTISAVGVLTDVPFDMLRGIYSSGIALHNGFSNSSDLVYGFTDRNPPPANIVAISDANIWDSLHVSDLQLEGYNLLQPFPCGSLESFFLQDSGLLEEDNCSESALWICKVCSLDGQGFENFTNHVTSRRHERESLDWLPGNARFLRRENTPNHGDKGKLEEEEEIN